MTAVAEPITILEEELFADLQPPCECRRLPEKVNCDKPAEWISTIECHNCGKRVVLNCNFHKEETAHGRATCRRCDSNGMRITLVAAERL